MNVNPYYIILTNLKTSASKTDVRISNWQGITERLFRSVDYGAINLNQTLPINFPRIGSSATDKGGYYFIDSAKNADGVKAQVQIEIKRLNSQTNSYVDSFIGMLDFRPSAGYNKQDEIIECKVIDSSKFSKFSSRDEIDYNVFDLVSSDNITVPDFTNPYTEATYKKIDIYLKSSSNGNFKGGELGVEMPTYTSVVPYYKVNDVLNINEIGDRLELSEAPTNTTIYNNDTKETTTFTDILISGEVYIGYSMLASGITWKIKLEIGFEVYDVDDIFLDDNYTQFHEINGIGDRLTSVTSGTSFTNLSLPDISVPSEGYMKYAIRISAETSSGVITFNYAIVNVYQPGIPGISDPIPATVISLFDMYEKTDGWPDNQIRGLYAHELLSRLNQLMNSETDTSKLVYSTITGKTDSEFQTYTSDGFLSRVFFTNGVQLRQLVNRALNINFKDAFKALNAITPIGCYYDKSNDYFVIEDIDNFYLSEFYSFDLGQVKDIKTTDFKNLYFNTILTGFPKTDYEKFNGANEVNTETEHEIPIEEKTKYDIRSPYHGDSKGQEFARRRNVSVAASEDTKYDNNVYLAKLNSSDETIQGIATGVTGYKGVEQDYNLELTPRQNLQRHFKIIQSPLYKAPSDIFSFRKSAKDTNITYTDPETLTLVNELDNLSQYAITDNIIDPELDEFEGIINEDIANEITENPHKIIKYLDREGNRKYGYIWEIEFNRYTKEATYRLIKVNENRIP
jgi:hypothetical protein